MPFLKRALAPIVPEAIRAMFAGAETAGAMRLSAEDVDMTRARLQRLLNGNVLAFWTAEALDSEGGYRLHHDRDGRWKGPAQKNLVGQSRTLWFFSRLAANNGRSDAEKLARHGFSFLREVFLDREFGGFYWEVDSGGRPTKDGKHLYGQAFALLALSEYASTFNDAQAQSLADQLFGHLQRHARDTVHGGYHEQFDRSWRMRGPQEPSYLDGDPCFMKHMNTHLHLLESVTAYCRLTRTAAATEALHELICVEANTIVGKDANFCRDRFATDWQPLLTPEDSEICYGHCLENIRMLMEACRIVSLPESLLAGTYRALFDYVSLHGVDEDQGGVFYCGMPNKRSSRRKKVWWVQAEALSTSLEIYRLTREARVWHHFLHTLDWIESHQADWTHGDWHQEIREDGQPAGDKASGWKTPYHNGGALLYCLRLLDLLESQN